jgi:CO dehydrogenase/acetyl-CoA synthase alpha subunit
MLERSVVSGIGWSKVVGSGSNLVATPIIEQHFSFRPPTKTPLRQAMNYAARKLHGANRCEGAS